MQSSYPNFQKSPYCGRGHPPPPSVVLFPRFGPMLTNPGYTTVTGIAKWYKPKMPQMIGIKEIQLRGWSWCMLYFIFYPLVMAFNVQENAVFIPKFSEISLCPPFPLKITAIYTSESILLNRIIISVHTKYGAQRAIKGLGGGGGGETRKATIFFSFQNTALLWQKEASDIPSKFELLMFS